MAVQPQPVSLPARRGFRSIVHGVGRSFKDTDWPG